MGSYIESATQNIRSIVEEIVTSEKSDIHLALVEYRDHPPQVRLFFLPPPSEDLCFVPRTISILG